jgi:integrase
MTKRTRGKRDYLYQRKGSSNWYVRLQGERDKGESLGTADRRVAEVMAASRIADHKARLLALRPRLEYVWAPALTPGRVHPGPDGGSILATERELTHIDAAGIITGKSPNGSLAPQAISGNTVVWLGDVPEWAPRPVVATKNGDDAILETYIRQNNLAPHFEREARTVWAIWRELTGGKLSIKDASREDGRKLAQHFTDQGLKSATVKKKVGWLLSAVNLAMAEKDAVIKFNPFAGVLPKKNDKLDKVPLSDDDMIEAARNLDQLSESDQVLFRLLACTGMRRGEAFQIDREHTERGVRFVVVGSKTDQSLRRVPLPAGVLAHLPAKIMGPLVAGTPGDLGKRLNKFIRKGLGITDKAKTLHSLRHRAQDRLRASGCPEDIRWAILGHEKATVAAGYGKGFPVSVLKRWIDEIGL